MSAEHPDASWALQAIADLEAWLAVPRREVTSQVTGGGAVRQCEEALAAQHGDRLAVLVPSATYGMRSVLSALGVGVGSHVLIPALDWGSTLAAVRSLGAVAEVVPVDPATGTIDPAALPASAVARAEGVVACHLHGVAADVPGLRAVVGPDVAVVEDCAQAYGSTLDGVPVGTLGDAAVFSFGPQKSLNAGEAAAVLVAHVATYDRVIELTAHPVRQRLAGVLVPHFAEFSMRVSQVAAVSLAQALARWDVVIERERHEHLVTVVEDQMGAVVLGGDGRRRSAARAVPVSADRARVAPPLVSHPSGALDITALIKGRHMPGTVHLVGRRDAE